LKIIIPIEDRIAIELFVSLRGSINKKDNFTVYCYFVRKGKVVNRFLSPQKDYIQEECIFQIKPFNSFSGTDSQRFINLYKNIQLLEIPTFEINKEKDRRIWRKYVEALKKLLKKKIKILYGK